MTPEQRLDLIAEEQMRLRERLAGLDQQILQVKQSLAGGKPEGAAPGAVPSPPEKAGAGGPAPATPFYRATPPPLPKTPAPAAAAPRDEPTQVIDLPPSLQVLFEKPLIPREEKPAPVSEVDAPAKVPRSPAPLPPPPIPTNRAAPSPGDFEMNLGKVWFVRIGVAAILTGLVLASVYAYKNFVHKMPPIVKVLALYVASFALADAGMWLERMREDLKKFGAVLTAGGLAAVYYTTFAMHHVTPLRVVESPVLAGLLLLICASGIFAYAHWQKSQMVAALALLLGYYGTAINPVGWFTLFSNFVLTLGGVWLLWRHRWVALGAIGLAGCYAGFAFWQYWFPLFTTGSLAPLDYWAGQGFLIGCWLLFTAVCLLSSAETLKVAQRAAIALSNNGAFFALFTVALLVRTPQSEKENAFAWFAFVFGAALLALCAAVERLQGNRGRNLSEIYLACGLIEISLGFAIKLGGWQLATVFAFQAALLAWMGAKQDRIVAKAGAAITAALVLFITLNHVPIGLSDTRFTLVGDSWPRGTSGWQPQLSVWIQAGMLLLGGWFSRGAAARIPLKFSGLSAWLCSVAMVCWTVRVIESVDAWWKPPLLIAFCGGLTAAGSGRALAFLELRRVAGVAAAIAASFIMVWIAIGEASRDGWRFTTPNITLTALLLLTTAWVSKREPWIEIDVKGKSLSPEALLHCAIAVLAWVLVVLIPLDEWWKPTVLILLCGALSLLGRWRRISLPELALVSRMGGVCSAAVIVWFAWMHEGQGRTPLDIAGATFNTLLLGIAAWLGRHHPGFERRSHERGFAIVALFYSTTAILNWTFTVLLPLDQEWQPALWVAFCAALVAVGKIRRVNLPELSVTAGFTAAAMIFHEVARLNEAVSRYADLWLMAACFTLVAAGLMKTRVWTCDPGWARALRSLAWTQAVFAFLHWWNVFEPALFPLATSLLGLVLGLLAPRLRLKAVVVAAFVMSVLALLSLCAGLVAEGWYPPRPWGWGVPLLVMGTECLLRRTEVFVKEERLHACNGLAAAAVGALWAFLTFHVLAHGSYRTMVWAGLALGIFLAGLLLHHAMYRRCGLCVLALALGRVVFYDVWQLETAARFASFLVIGAVLVALGFFYNRFEALIRKYL